MFNFKKYSYKMKFNVAHKSSLLILLLTFLTKFLGLLKQVLLFSKFGISSKTDIYIFSYSIIIVISYIMFSSLRNSIIPVLSKYHSNNNHEKINQTVSLLIIIYSLVSIFIIFLIFFFPKQLIIILFKKYNYNDISLFVYFTRILSIIFIFDSLQIILTSILELNNIFFYSALLPLFTNLFISLSLIFVKSNDSYSYLIIAIIISYLLQLIIIIFRCKKLFSFNLSFKLNKEVKEILILTLPIMLSNSVYMLNDLIDKIISIRVSTGSLSILTSSQTLYGFIVSIFVVSIINVYFPLLSKVIAKNDLQKVNKYYINITLTICFFLFPVTIFVIFYSSEIVTIVFGHGNFNDDAVFLSAKLLSIYTIGVIFTVLRRFIITFFYNFKKNKSALYNSIITIFINIGLSLFFSIKYGIVGVAMSTSIAMIISVCIFHIQLKKFFLVEYSLLFPSIIKIIKSSFSTLFLLSMIKYFLTSNLYSISFAFIVCLFFYILILFILKFDFKVFSN